jgi:hypothetical protein
MATYLKETESTRGIERGEESFEVVGGWVFMMVCYWCNQGSYMVYRVSLRYYNMNQYDSSELETIPIC